ncbi:MAG TPA: chemotaxis protein CheB [Longimicrobiaceae bacterium]|nr:chemotaxis protein CheB [Longimicrobiaceae bacterium]
MTVAPVLVMIGVSAGGLDAVCTLLRGLPEDFRMALVVVQHRSKDSDALCEVLQECTPLPVHEATDKASAEQGKVYLAPPDYHLLLEDGYFSLSTDAPEMYSRPSIDVAFESAADAYGARVVGVVLTGANHDGARGLRRIVDRGGTALVQDPATAEVAVMPAAALRAVPEAEVLTLPRIAERLLTLQTPPATPGGKR